jgi:dTDP-4-amino-4,6-dideoxygalactose transaminase
MHLEEKVARRRQIAAHYHQELGYLPGITFPDVARDEGWNGWLTCLTIDPEAAGTDREAVRLALRREGIEARPVWKPMHLQPAFAGGRTLGGGNAAVLFERGLCLPSGSSLTGSEQGETVELVRLAWRGEGCVPAHRERDSACRSG